MREEAGEIECDNTAHPRGQACVLVDHPPEALLIHPCRLRRIAPVNLRAAPGAGDGKRLPVLVSLDPQVGACAL